MPSLMEIVERVNKGEVVDAELLDVYQESNNSAEKFLAHHARAQLDLRRSQTHMLQALEAIDYSDQKVLGQFVNVCNFLGMSDARSQPVIRFGASAIARRETALGLEALQNGVSHDFATGGAFTADRENCVFIAQQYDRAGQAASWYPSGDLNWNNKQTRVAYITTAVVDDEASARLMMGLAKNIDAKRFKLSVYSTEATVRHDKQQYAGGPFTNSSAKRGKETIDTLTRRKTSVFLTPCDADLLGAAKALADQLVRDQIDVAIFDAGQNDPIAALLTGWNCAKVKLNFARRGPLLTTGIDAVCYLDQARYEADKTFLATRNTDARAIIEGIDLEEITTALPQRSAYGIPDQSVILATAGPELDKSLTPEFVETIINILRAHPHAVYLLIGEGDFSQQKRRFEAAGVGKRVGYTGKRKDLPGFLRIADIYLSEFPSANAAGVLGAMSVERPVVAMQWSDSAENQAAAFVGSEGAIIGHDANAYVERVSKLIREPNLRSKLGKAMKTRIEQHYGFNQTARAIEQLCDELIQQRTGDGPAITPEAPLAQVA